jgi:hypothetical protein
LTSADVVTVASDLMGGYVDPPDLG